MTGRPSRIEQMADNWPIYARLLGAGIGVAEMVAGFAGLPVSTPILGFAGGLLLAPRIAGIQQRRNQVRKAAAAVLDPDRTPDETPEDER
jgi:hypothetical protein